MVDAFKVCFKTLQIKIDDNERVSELNFAPIEKKCKFGQQQPSNVKPAFTQRNSSKESDFNLVYTLTINSHINHDENIL